jgi:hypothetical protein
VAFLKPNAYATTPRAAVSNPDGAWDGGVNDSSSLANVYCTISTVGATGYATFSGFTAVGAVSTPIINVNWAANVSDEGIYTGYTAISVLVNGAVVASDTYPDAGVGMTTFSFQLPEGTDPSTVTVRVYANIFKYTNPDWVEWNSTDPEPPRYIWESSNIDVYDIWMTYVIPMPQVTSLGQTGLKINAQGTLYGNFWDISAVRVVSQYTNVTTTFSVTPDRTTLTFTMPVATPNSGDLVDIQIINPTGTTTVSNFSLISPHPTSMSPSIGGLGSVLAINGSGFLYNVSAVKALVNGSYVDANNYNISSDSLISGITFNGLVDGPIGIYVFGLNGNAYGLTYTAVAAPTLSSQPGTKKIGEVFTLSGSNFHQMVSVTHSGTGLPYSLLSDSLLQFTATKAMNGHTIAITNAGGTVTSAAISITPVTVAIDTVPPYQTVGHSYGFTATVTGAIDTNVTWSVVSGNGHFIGAVLFIDGPGAIAIRATSTADPTISASGVVTGVAVPTASLAAVKPIVTVGSTTSVVASFTGGMGSVDHGVGTVSSGTPAGTPAINVSTNYTLTVTNLAGDTALAYTFITAVVAPVASGITPGVATVAYGGGTTLTPSFSNGTGSMSPVPNGAVTNGQAYPTGGLTANQRYTLVVTNAAGDTATATCDVTVLQPVVSSVTATKTVMTYASGLQVTCYATVDNAINAGVIWGGDVPINASGVVTIPAQPSSGIETAGSGVNSYRTYTVTAASAAKPSVTNSLALRVYAVPRIQNIITTNIAEASYGATPYGLPPSIYVGADGWFNGTAVLTGVGAIALNSTYSLPAVTAPASYTVTVTNPDGATATKTFSFTPLTVVVSPLTYSVVSGNFVGAGQGVGLSTSVSGAYSPDVSWSCTGGSFTSVGGTTVTWNAPATPGDYTVTATSKSNAAKTQSAVFHVVPAPVISSFTQDSPNPLLYGQSLTVTPVYSALVGKVGPTRIVTGGDWSSPNASGAGVTYNNVTRAFTSSLSVKNEVGITAYADLNVTVQAVSMVPLVPAYVEADAQHQFATSVSGAVNTAVNWSCTGGSIDATGLWTAPTHYGRYTITATSAANGLVAVSTVATVPLQRKYIVKKLSSTASSN